MPLSKWSSLLTLLLLVCGCVGLPFNENLPPMPQGVIYFDCDTPAHRISFSTHLLPSAYPEVKGELRINTERHRIAPYALISVLNSANEPLFSHRLQLYNRSFQVSISVFAEEAVEHFLIQEGVKLGETIPFSFVMTDTKTVTGHVGTAGEAVKFNINGQPRKLQLKCGSSWSEMTILELK